MLEERSGLPRILRGSCLPVHLRKHGQRGAKLSPRSTGPRGVPRPSVPSTCIHWSSKFSSSGHTVSLHLAFLARAVTDFRKSSFSEILGRAGRWHLTALGSGTQAWVGEVTQGPRAA